ncbi:MAG: hypothetical protein ABGX16_00230 [Pirellulales bacterium]
MANITNVSLDVHAQRAIKLLSDLVDRFPDNQHYRYELIETLRSDFFGPPHLAEGRERTQQSLRDALFHANHLIERYPNVPQYAVTRMHVLHKLRHVLTHMARSTTVKEQAAIFEESKFALEGADTQIRILVKRWPKVFSYQFWSAVVDGSLAQVCLDIGQNGDAKEALASALTTLNGLRQTEHLATHVHSHLPNVCSVLSDLAQRAKAEDLVREMESERKRFNQ